MFYQSTGKEIFSDYVQQFVSQTLFVQPPGHDFSGAAWGRGYPHPFVSSCYMYSMRCPLPPLLTHIHTQWEHPGVVVVVYDVTNTQSFSSCSKWLERVRAQRPAAEVHLPGALVANKVDLESRRVVGEEEGRGFAGSKELQYFETSVVRTSY